MIWLDKLADLTQFLQNHADIKLLVMDTEFIRERTYFPELALIQICVNDQIALIDPTQPGIAEQLVPLLTNPNILKIMHSSSEDLQAFKAGCGVVPSPIFDTQVAAALCGLGSGLSYLKLVEQVCDITLTKGETRSDWLQRPLTESQKQYAADDVRYLLPIYQLLETKLSELNRREWLDADCQRAVAAASDDLADANPHLSVRTNQSLDQGAQLRLRRLLVWREQRAIEKNKPKRWIIDNDVAFALSRNPITDINTIDHILARYPKSPKGARAHLFALLQKPFSEEELQAPTIAEPAQNHKSQLKALQQVVLEVASELNVPEGLLCSRKHLEYLLETGLWPPTLQGWRKQLLSDQFKPIINNAN
ncbi:MAG: ribonuclease D [Arenimonas sp.]|nr:ribonuclease D [Arenimonas sp.]MBP6310342.1 ribonuclease D [Arenimonas sp.]